MNARANAAAVIAALDADERRLMLHQARAEAWRRVAEGRLSVDFALHSKQREAAAMLRANKAALFYLSIARQFGKSILLFALVLEMLWRKPRSLWHWWAPLRDDAVDIVRQKTDIVLAGCPVGLIPRLNEKDIRYKLPNGAELHFFGANNERSRFARGRTVDGIVIDEAAEIDNLPNLINSVCLPMLLHSGGSIWMSSTPAILADHPSYDFLRACLSRGDAYRATIFDNPLLTIEQIERQKQACGGADSAAWKREHLVELDVVDADSVLVPEWSRLKAELAVRWQRPDYWGYLRRYVGIDPGVSDRTGIVYATYDFPEHTIRVERARLMVRASTSDIAAQVRADEKDLWPGANGKHTFRVADDNQGRLVLDLCDEGLTTSKAIKDDREAGIGLLRTWVARKHLKVDPDEAAILSRQLEHAHEVRRKLARNLEGHFDAFTAALYLVRAIELEKHLNPLPTHEWLTSRRRPKSQRGRSKLLEAFSAPSHRK